MRALSTHSIWTLAFVFAFGSSNADAQVSVANVLSRVVAAVSVIENGGDQILFIQIDNLTKGSTDTQTYTLHSGNSYSVMAIGDAERIQDIDLKVYDENDNKVGEDADTQNVARVTLTPRWSGSFKFALSAFRMSQMDGFYGIIVYRED